MGKSGGACSQDGCVCSEDKDCQQGAQCNTRGFCTDMKKRNGAECVAKEGSPKETVIEEWKKLVDALTAVAGKNGVAVPANAMQTPTPLIEALAAKGVINDKVKRALDSLAKISQSALADTKGTAINQETADRFTKLAGKVGALVAK